VWGRSADGDGGRGHVDTSSPRSIGGIDLDDLLELVEELSGFAQTLDAVADALGELPGSVFAWRSTEAGEGVQAAIQAVGGVTRLLRLFSSLNVHAAREARLSSVSSIIRGLESLGIRGRDGSVSTPLLEFLEPVLAHLVEGRPLDSGLLFRLASSIDERAVLAAFGERAASACRDDEGSLACWTVRIVQSLHEATTIGEGGISIDGAVFRTALASLGEDFRARHEWRTYFHLTIGLGELATLGPAPGVLDAMGQPLAGGMRAQPIVSEQIGLGIASPVFFRDRFAFRTGLYASGILFRVALDTEESEALIFGAFAALDLYQLLQVYVSPLLLLYPSEGDAGPAARFGFSAGVQIPLGDYLSAL
ncbi:MAG: hypothetical protein OEY14_09540, partial [Myxococcales bacterium]|nr:hypothetical protein [Myxococcales bacterium]